MEYRTNDELAQDWYRLANSVGTNTANRHLQSKIANSSTDIPQHYRERGNLDDLRVSGIGAKIKHQMGLLFEYGLDEARKILSQEQQDSSRDENRWVGRDKPGKRGDSTSDSWDDAVRRYEG